MWIQTAISSLLLMRVLSSQSPTCIIDGGCTGSGNSAAGVSTKTECRDSSTVTTSYTDSGDCSTTGTEVTADGCEACTSYALYSMKSYGESTDCTGDFGFSVASVRIGCVTDGTTSVKYAGSCATNELVSTSYGSDDCTGSVILSETFNDGCQGVDAAGVSVEVTITECVSGASQISAMLLWIVIALNIFYS
eukprot:118092_1